MLEQWFWSFHFYSLKNRKIQTFFCDFLYIWNKERSKNILSMSLNNCVHKRNILNDSVIEAKYCLLLSCMAALNPAKLKCILLIFCKVTIWYTFHNMTSFLFFRQNMIKIKRVVGQRRCRTYTVRQTSRHTSTPRDCPTPRQRSIC